MPLVAAALEDSAFVILYERRDDDLGVEAMNRPSRRETHKDGFLDLDARCACSACSSFARTKNDYGH